MREHIKISTATLAKFSKNEPVAMKVIEDICEFLDCQLGDMMDIDDIIETVNHFKCFDYILDHAEDMLNENIVKEVHSILKANTSDARLEWFQVGDYKKRPNMIGDFKTTPPGRVRKDMERLLFEYQQKESISFEDIIEFHYHFEKIHPFQDADVIIGTRLENPVRSTGLHSLVPIFYIPKGENGITAFQVFVLESYIYCWPAI